MEVLNVTLLWMLKAGFGDFNAFALKEYNVIFKFQEYISGNIQHWRNRDL